MAAEDTQVGGDHYTRLAIQPWAALEAWFTPDEFRGFLKGSAIAYLAREMQKGGPMDVEKARHCLDRLIEFDKAVAARG